MGGQFVDYFSSRGVSQDYYKDYQLAAYFSEVLPVDSSAKILDFGCGFGQILSAIKSRGYNILGYDVEPEAIKSCVERGLCVVDEVPNGERFDFIIVSHVLEHFDKDKVVSTLVKLRSMLEPDGSLFVCVPNAQSNTGCYWAYEDFTHNMLFTAGSLFYVLRKAGFKEIRFIDPDCTAGLGSVKRALKCFFLFLYRKNYQFWNRVTGSAFHRPSPTIFSYEIKALARG